jgi:hypothetical protein
VRATVVVLVREAGLLAESMPAGMLPSSVMATVTLKTAPGASRAESTSGLSVPAQLRVSWALRWLLLSKGGTAKARSRAGLGGLTPTTESVMLWPASASVISKAGPLLLLTAAAAEGLAEADTGEADTGELLRRTWTRSTDEVVAVLWDEAAPLAFPAAGAVYVEATAWTKESRGRAPEPSLTLSGLLRSAQDTTKACT